MTRNEQFQEYAKKTGKQLHTVKEILDFFKDLDPMDDLGLRATIDIKDKYICVATGRGWDYEIPFHACKTPSQIMGWVCQLKDKNWCDAQTMYDFLTAVGVAFEVFEGGSLRSCMNNTTN